MTDEMIVQAYACKLKFCPDRNPRLPKVGGGTRNPYPSAKDARSAALRLKAVLENNGLAQNVQEVLIATGGLDAQ